MQLLPPPAEDNPDAPRAVLENRLRKDSHPQKSDSEVQPCEFPQPASRAEMCPGKSLKHRKPEWELYRCRIEPIPSFHSRSKSLLRFSDLDLITPIA